MLTVALDAMGGDHAPKAEVEGAVLAARQLGVKVILVGQEDLVRQELSTYADSPELPIEVVHASQNVTMDDPTKAVRTKRDSSVKVASRLVRDGRAAGLVSAGNTGAVMATAKTVQGMVPGVKRPALAGLFPTSKGPTHPVIVLDVGANVDCSPQMLAQFAVMGEIYARIIIKRDRPRVGLLSIGELRQHLRRTIHVGADIQHDHRMGWALGSGEEAGRRGPLHTGHHALHGLRGGRRGASVAGRHESGGASIAHQSGRHLYRAIPAWCGQPWWGRPW